MARNAILLISTLAVLLLLFVGYSAFVGDSARQDDVPARVAALPQTTQVADENKLRIEGIALDPGEKMGLVEYDAFGRPVRSFQCGNWEKVLGTEDQLAVSKPELVMRLPSGMIVTITAEQGQVSAERVQAKRVQPKSGWLAGDARIVIDRETSFERTPLNERPEDRITIEMERLEFDLGLGELKTAEQLRVSNPDFEITGTGLHLIWNEGDNRVEKLVIERGGQMVLEGNLLASLGGSPEQERTPDHPSAVSQPTRSTSTMFPQKARKLTSYRCVFSGGVAIDHYVGQRPAGALHADELMLLFDVGGQGRDLPRREKTPTSAPASAPASQPDEAASKRLVVAWNGRLSLDPAPRPTDPEQSRRHFEAVGQPVTVTLPNGSVRCSRLVMHEETKRLWLYPEEDGVVEVSSADTLAVKAASVFLDLESNIVKLIGTVVFRSSTRPGHGDQSLSIECDLWAELHLAARDSRNLVGNVFDNPLGSRPPESAVFVGDVRVEYQDQLLRAHRLDALFRQAEDHSEAEALTEIIATTGSSEVARQSPTLQALLESVIATGDVHLIMGGRSARRSWRGLLGRRVDVLKRAFARTLSKRARGTAPGPAADEDRTLECASLRLDFASVNGQVRIREMEGTGAVAIYDRHSRFAARGRKIVASFTGREEPDRATAIGREQLEHATVTGSETVPALVRAQAYALRGKEVKVDNRAGTLHIDGRSRLTFRSTRSLQGLARRSAEPITVTSDESMHVDHPGNTVNFIGQVVAGTGDEQLLADSLTLLLKDVEVSRLPTLSSQIADLVRLTRGKLGDRSHTSAPRSYLVAKGARSGDHKELSRLMATNAELRSVVYAPGDPTPLVYQSVTGPELEVDIPRRLIRTSGTTTLSMTDRRSGGDDGARGAGLGIPSALMSSGPSQTAMECRHGLVYVLGEDGPQRKDSVLLEGSVVFVHVTGREMVDLGRTLPRLAANQESLENIRSRHTRMECDRLEGIFAAASEARGQSGEFGLRPSLQLSWINAVGNVYLRDQQDAAIRSVYAHQLEFDRPSGVIRVLGLEAEGIDARIYDENTETNRFSIPAIGPEIIINLETSTVQTRRIRGQSGG